MPFHDLKTALMPPQSCSYALSGKGLPKTSTTRPLKASHKSLRSSSDRSVSLLYPFLTLTSCSILSSCTRIPFPSSGSTPSDFSITTSEYIIMRRRYASYTNLGFPVFLIRPGIVSAHKPMLRTVSIMPGIELLAPERHEMRRGASLSPNFIFITASALRRASSTSFFSSAGN